MLSMQKFIELNFRAKYKKKFYRLSNWVNCCRFHMRLEVESQHDLILRSSSPLFQQIVKSNKQRTLFEKSIVALLGVKIQLRSNTWDSQNHLQLLLRQQVCYLAQNNSYFSDVFSSPPDRVETSSKKSPKLYEMSSIPPKNI